MPQYAPIHRAKLPKNVERIMPACATRAAISLEESAAMMMQVPNTKNQMKAIIAMRRRVRRRP